MHIPGLTVVYPSTPSDAKELLKASIRNNSPVIFVEHKYLYGMRGPVSTADISAEIGKAVKLTEGNKLTVVTYGRMVHYCLKAIEELDYAKNNVEVIDLRTLKPLDKELLVSSVTKTGRLLVVEEAHGICGVAAEVASLIAEEAFSCLKAPPQRLSAADVPVPFSPYLEDKVFPSVEDIKTAVKKMIGV
jgi:pyruvate dehydrogenase E1 component beta subunit